MPVTAKLSKAFYEQVGEQAATELVDWLNAVDQSYRADLRELNELNFARFDAKLEQRIAEVRSEIGGLGAKFESLDAKVGGLEVRIGGLETKVGGLEVRIGGLEMKVGGLETKVGGLETKVGALDAKFGVLEAKIEGMDAKSAGLFAKLEATLDAKISAAGERQAHFLMLGWVTLLVPILIGLWTRS